MRPFAVSCIVPIDGRILFVRHTYGVANGRILIPGGYLQENELPSHAAERELLEETGVTADKIELIARAPRELTYDLPEDMIGKVWKGKWRGQRQTWFLYRFLGQDGDIRIETERPEFRAWRWIEPASLPAMIVPFKKALYEELLVVFADHFAAAGGDAAIPAGGQSA